VSLLVSLRISEGFERYKAALNGRRGSLSTVRHAQLAQQPVDVRLDRGL
jgi:hypothetical protein